MRPQSTAKIHAPKCSLPFCDNRVGYHKSSNKVDGSPVWKWKTFCECHRKKQKFEAEEWMKSVGCQNKSGYLGWFCRDPNTDSLTIDHHDGDKLNTSPENIKVLCANCHNKKTKIFGDHKKRYSYTNPMYPELFKEI